MSLRDEAWCGHCEFFSPFVESGVEQGTGYCRFSLPAANTVDQWPIVRESDWCRKFLSHAQAVADDERASLRERKMG